MTKAEWLLALQVLPKDRELRWLQDLGYELTIPARGAYVPSELAADAVQLMGYNELQHQLYGRISSLQAAREWPLESFLDGLLERARNYNVEGGLGYALRKTARSVGI